MLINCASHPFRASINLGSGGSVWFSVLFCFSLAENERIMCCNHVCVDCNEKKMFIVTFQRLIWMLFSDLC